MNIWKVSKANLSAFWFIIFLFILTLGNTLIMSFIVKTYLNLIQFFYNLGYLNQMITTTSATTAA